MKAEDIAASLSEAQRRVFTSRKVPNDYRAEDALAFQRMGLLSFTLAGDVISSPLGLAVRSHLMKERGE